MNNLTIAVTRISCDHVFRGLCDFMAWRPFVITHHLIKFNGDKPGGSRGIIYLICHVTMQNHVIKESCGYIKGCASLMEALPPNAL